MELICLRLLIQAVISGMQLKGGDIETNPGPTYNLQLGEDSAWVLSSEK